VVNTEQLWPGWQTVGMIGKGGFGAVYEIRRSIFGEEEKAALKVISIPQSECEIEDLYSEGYDRQGVADIYEQHLKNIVSEYTLARKISECKNVVFCEDVRYEPQSNGVGWNVFIKMELLTPLGKAFVAPLSEEMVCKLGMDLCNALDVCKKQGILHRDVKPQNIFVSEKGDFKLGDFGIAKAAEKTKGGTKIGTYKYMAPEVYNNEPYGSAADIYSLGLVLYWLLNERRMPFLPMPPVTPSFTDEEDAKLRRFRGEPLPPPKNGSPALQKVVMKACAFRPADRYADAGQMLAALKAVHNTPKKQAPVAAHSENKKPKKKRWLWILLPILLLLLAGAFVISKLPEWTAPAPEQEKSAATENTQPSTKPSTQPSSSQSSEEESQESSTPPVVTGVSIGSTIQLGAYEQDGNRENGAEDIEWIVLDVQDRKVLLISKYALDHTPFHTSGTTVTWETSTLRQWLNEDFYNLAFDDGQKETILLTDVRVDKDSAYQKDPGANTQDKLFLLSVSEVNQYFSDADDRRCVPTAYAASEGTWKNGEGYCWWWLRTPGYQLDDAFCVFSQGKIDEGGSALSDAGGGVRPAMWVDLRTN